MNKNLHPSPTPANGPGELSRAAGRQPGLPGRVWAAARHTAARLLGFASRHKKAAFLLAAILCTAAALGIWKALSGGPARINGPAAEAGGYLRTVTLERTTLENSVSASGTVESARVSTVTTALSYAVKTVEVQVGDEVKAGDVICTLDTEDLERQIEQRQRTADRAVRKAQEALDDAQQNRDEAAGKLADAEAEEEDAEDAYNEAWSAFNAACAKVSQFRTAYEQAYDALQTALSSYNSVYTPAYQAAETRCEQAAAQAAEAEAALRAAQAGVDTARDALGTAETAALNAAAPDTADPDPAGEAAPQTPDTELARQALDEASAEQEAAQQALDAAIAEQEAAQQALDEAYAGAEAARQAYEQAQQQEQAAEEAFAEAKRACNYDTLKTQKDTATTLWESAKTASENAAAQLKQAEKTLASARTALAEAGEDEELETLQRTLADCTLTAASDGTVTSLDATVGSKCSGTVATIQDTGALKVAFTLAEYDVDNVAVGMQAAVTSDATTEPIAGQLTQISPTTSAAGGGTGNGTAGGSSEFAAEVTLTGTPDGLRIGMNAKVEIIQSTAEDVFVVPYDAVGENEDGSRYILVKTGAGDGADAFEPVSVTTGAENDYYIEVRGEALREGMTVRASALDEASAAQSGAEQPGGDGFIFGMDGGMAGMPGGGMGGAPAGGPGGGGMP